MVDFTAVILFVWHPGKGKTTVMENKSVVARGEELGAEVTKRSSERSLGSNPNLYSDCNMVSPVLHDLKPLEFNIYFKKSISPNDNLISFKKENIRH